MDDAGIFADPPDPGIFGINALKDWSSITITAGLNSQVMFVSCLFDCGFNLSQPRQQRVMIVLAAPGIAGDPATLRIDSINGIRLVSAVVQGANHHRPDPGSGVGG